MMDQNDHSGSGSGASDVSHSETSSAKRSARASIEQQIAKHRAEIDKLEKKQRDADLKRARAALKKLVGVDAAFDNSLSAERAKKLASKLEELAG